jgi:hypothetical protein
MTDNDRIDVMVEQVSPASDLSIKSLYVSFRLISSVPMIVLTLFFFLFFRFERLEEGI